MCYFLYGAVNEGINKNDYEKYACHWSFRFAPGTRHQVKACIDSGGQEFRLTDRHCDCDTAIGSGRAEERELLELVAMIGELRKMRGVKRLYLCKNWMGKRTREEKSVHVEDISLRTLLAELKESCLYSIELFERY